MTTISQERAGLVKVGRSLRTREQARFRFNYSTVRTVTEPARAVFVHITITNPSNYASDDAHARAVEAIGISRFPATGISYNRLHMQSGKAYEGQPIGRRGAHTVNDKALAACSTAGCPSRGARFPSGNLNYSVRAYAICQNVGHAVTDAELDSLARSIAADQLAGFVVKGAPIHGHRCVAYKDCPAGKMWARMGELKRLVNHYLLVGFKPAQDVTISATAVRWAAAGTRPNLSPGEPLLTGTYAHDAHQFMAFARVRNAIPQNTFDSWLAYRNDPTARVGGPYCHKAVIVAIAELQEQAGLPRTGKFDEPTAAFVRRFGYTVTQ